MGISSFLFGDSTKSSTTGELLSGVAGIKTATDFVKEKIEKVKADLK